MDLHTLQKYGWGLVGLICVITLSVILCSGPSKPPKFVDRAEDFCKTLDSKVVFSNESKRIVVCD